MWKSGPKKGGINENISETGIKSVVCINVNS